MDTPGHLRRLTDEPRLMQKHHQFTSRLSTATDSLPGGSSINNSRSRVDKSAERIATYVTVYAQKSISERSSKSSKSSFRSHRQEFSQTQSSAPKSAQRPIHTESHIDKEKTQGNIRSLMKQMEALSAEISLAKSDRLELFRDLATFEHEFAETVQLSGKLKPIHEMASELPGVMSAYGSVSAEAVSIVSLMTEGMKRLSEVTKPSIQTYRTSPSLGLGLRQISYRHHIRSQYRGAWQISGLNTLVCVMSDEALEHFQISVQTLDGAGFSFALKHTLMQDLAPRKAIRQRLLPYLHFTCLRGQLLLHFDVNLGSTFITVITEVRGVKDKLCFTLTEDDENVRITCKELDCHTTVPLEALTSTSTLGEANCSQLRDSLSKKLLLKLNPVQLTWLEEEDGAFKLKEKSSKLMDADYLSEALGDFVLMLMVKEELHFDGELFVIELYAHRDVEKVRITHEEHTEELDSESPYLSLLKDLQFNLFQKETKTLFKSLELMLCVRALFLNKSKSL